MAQLASNLLSRGRTGCFGNRRSRPSDLRSLTLAMVRCQAQEMERNSKVLPEHCPVDGPGREPRGGAEK